MHAHKSGKGTITAKSYTSTTKSKVTNSPRQWIYETHLGKTRRTLE